MCQRFEKIRGIEAVVILLLVEETRLSQSGVKALPTADLTKRYYEKLLGYSLSDSIYKEEEASVMHQRQGFTPAL